MKQLILFSLLIGLVGCGRYHIKKPLTEKKQEPVSVTTADYIIRSSSPLPRKLSVYLSLPLAGNNRFLEVVYENCSPSNFNLNSRAEIERAGNSGVVKFVDLEAYSENRPEILIIDRGDKCDQKIVFFEDEVIPYVDPLPNGRSQITYILDNLPRL